MSVRAQKPNSHAWWVLILCLAVSCALAIITYLMLEQQTRYDVERTGELYAERTESIVNAIFHKTDTLAAVVKLENGDISESVFETVAKLVYEPDAGIRGIQYMPGAVVTYSYPLAGNEGVMGKNFFEIPERRDDVMLAIETKSIALSGPYNLIQGGLGVVARNPVFLTDKDGQEYFWGFSTIVLDLPDALGSADLEHLPAAGYDYQLFSVNELGERLVIAGNENLDVDGAIYNTIEVPHHEWTLVLTPLHPWGDLLRAVGILMVGVLLSLLIWQLYRMMLRERAATLSKDRFFSDISHDMRTPLNAVIGFSSLARKPGLTAEQKDEYLEKIQSSGELLLNLVNDTLTISKAGSGKMQLNLKPINSDVIMASLDGTVREMAEQKGVELIVDKTGYVSQTISVDRLAVEKVLLNLLNNAVRFTPTGGHVWASVENLPAGDDEARYLFTVRDDGIGIGADFLPHVFEPFSQEQQKGYEGTGTGLGLSIVKELVDLMGGTIEVQSEKGIGTTFQVKLCFALSEAPAEDVQAEGAPARGAKHASVTLGGRRVLLCEDNEINREIAVQLLEIEKMDVDAETNGEDGVARFAASDVGHYDCVLMDLRMPRMNGYEATRAIRALRRSDARTIPIIAMTADAFSDDVQRCLDAGMNAHIAKPIDPQSMYQVLRDALAGGGTR